MERLKNIGNSIKQKISAETERIRAIEVNQPLITTNSVVSRVNNVVNKEEVMARIEPYNIVRRLNNMESWIKDFADPSIKSNILDIGTMYNDITKVIVPNLNATKKDVSALYNEITNTVVPNVNDSLAMSTEARDKALVIYNKALLAADSSTKALKNATDALNTSSSLYGDITNNVIPKLNTTIADVSIIYNEMKGVIVPKVENSLSLAIAAKDKAQLIYDKAMAAANSASKAITDAATSLNMTTDFFSRLKNAGSKLREDTLRIKYAAEDLIFVARTELNRIAAAFEMLGNNVGDAAGTIYNKSKSIGTAIGTAYDEISVPVNKAKEYFDKVEHPDNLLDFLAILFNIAMAFGHLTVLPWGGQQGAFLEVMDAFSKISTEFKNLGIAFLGFGDRIKQDIPKVYEAINLAANNLAAAFNKFLASFSLMTSNLSLNLSPSVT